MSYFIEYFAGSAQRAFPAFLWLQFQTDHRQSAGILLFRQQTAGTGGATLVLRDHRISKGIFCTIEQVSGCEF